ncbi:MAG: GFA family protein [Alphaproteobacteria bacterium]|nr:GFA family protein [Alphaproteobacteria bacterium]
MTSGQLKFYEKIAASGTVRALAFCPECGTRIYAKTVGEGTGFLGLPLGTIRQRRKFKPKLQVWHQSALDWGGDLNSIPKMDQQPSLDGR